MKSFSCGSKGLSGLSLMLILALSSCNKSSDVLSSGDTQNVNSESDASTYTNESADMSNSVMTATSDTQLASGRTTNTIVITTGEDDRLACATITLTKSVASTRDVPQGTILVDFGTGCTDLRGVTRKGQMNITYKGLRWAYGSYRVLTFTNYFRNDVGIQGIDSVVNVTANSDTTQTTLKYRHVINNGVITFGDGKTITRDQNITRQWTLSLNNLLNSQVADLAGGTASGKTKEGANYSMQITENIIYTVACALKRDFIAVSGEKTLTVGSFLYTIDYGSGTCDNTITITLNGKSKAINVGAEGN
jgi:hypothetical protein